MESLHVSGYVVGDFNESNILTNNQSLVTFIDTDSFQVTDKVRQTYRCTVGKEEFTPPELQGKDFKQVDRFPEHDLFGLGVMTFYLLMEGVHPFQGVLTNSSLSVGRVDLYCIKQGLYPHQSNNPFVNPPPNALPFGMLHPRLQKLFTRCFVDGHQNPFERPTPQEWKQGLETAINDLTTCKREPSHLYYRGLSKCPWCVRQKKQKSTPQSQVPLKPPSSQQRSITPTPATAQQPTNAPSLLSWLLGSKTGLLVSFCAFCFVAIFFIPSRNLFLTPVAVQTATHIPDRSTNISRPKPTPILNRSTNIPRPKPINTPKPTKKPILLTSTPDYKFVVRSTVLRYADYKIQSTTYLDSSDLDEILIDPVLERQKRSTCWLDNEGFYYEYSNRNFDVENVYMNGNRSATVIARIRENRVLRKSNGTTHKDYGYEEYQAIYKLKRYGNDWYISCFQAVDEDNPLNCEVKWTDDDPC